MASKSNYMASPSEETGNRLYRELERQLPPTVPVPSVITAEDVKRWYQLLVGLGEEAMQADIKNTLQKVQL